MPAGSVDIHHGVAVQKVAPAERAPARSHQLVREFVITRVGGDGVGLPCVGAGEGVAVTTTVAAGVVAATGGR